ncbi:MAG TPA: peptide-methionine (R)-S-oxide reductase MsrB [Sphingobium sp.]|uniref:peptide-methionine (R)-S-oxide reductase MsrB n=1 Tax=Sphingobium sp. TaxID=1912891 RepID=UPI002ED2A4C1
MTISRRAFLGGSLLAAGAIVFAGTGWLGEWEAEAAPYPFMLSDAEWKKRLTDGQYRVLRHAATEAPYSSPLNSEHRAGTFICAGCSQQLFSSKTKFDSGTGWPSFWEPISKTAVRNRTDATLGMERVEILCARCGGHLGHVFEDGPKPTGLRYCMNGVAMKFVPA